MAPAHAPVCAGSLWKPEGQLVVAVMRCSVSQQVPSEVSAVVKLYSMLQYQVKPVATTQK